ncbi:MAG: ATP/GTP-binding protein [Actinomycetota bacterium]
MSPRNHKQRKRKKRSPAAKRKAPSMWDGLYGIVEVRRVQPYEARKEYVCPGCHRTIPVGVGHLVCVPHDAPDLRRHWHKGCWDRQTTDTKNRPPLR